MNRHDEIFCKARDIASHVHVDPEARDAMATQLIELIGLMFGAVGKYVAIKGESASNDVCDNAPACGHAECDVQQHHTIYIAGERMQDAARELVPEVIDADVERYSRPSGAEWCVCGHHPDSHKPGGCIGVTHNKHECTDGPCTEFRVKLPEPVWVHEDRPPGLLRQLDGRGTLHIPPGNVPAPVVCYCHHSGCPNGQLDEFVAAAAAEVKQPSGLDCDCLLCARPRATETAPSFEPGCDCQPHRTDDGYQRELTCALTVAELSATDPSPLSEQIAEQPADPCNPLGLSSVPEVKQAEPCCYPDPDEAPGHPCRIGRGWCCYPLGGVCPNHL